MVRMSFPSTFIVHPHYFGNRVSKNWQAKQSALGSEFRVQRSKVARLRRVNANANGS
jgi:hypothetical protein